MVFTRSNKKRATPHHHGVGEGAGVGSFATSDTGGAKSGAPVVVAGGMDGAAIAARNGRPATRTPGDGETERAEAGCGGATAPGSTSNVRAFRDCPSCSKTRSGRGSSSGPVGLALRSAISVNGIAGTSLTVVWFLREMIWCSVKANSVTPMMTSETTMDWRVLMNWRTLSCGGSSGFGLKCLCTRCEGSYFSPVLGLAPQ